MYFQLLRKRLIFEALWLEASLEKHVTLYVKVTTVKRAKGLAF
jgi:hypothetical protein